MTLRAGFDVPLIVLNIRVWSAYRLRCTEQNTTLKKSGLTESVNEKGIMLPHIRDILDTAKHGSEMITSKMNVKIK